MKLAVLMRRYMDEMRCGGALKHLLTLPIAQAEAPGTSRDYILHCRMRRSTVAPSMVAHDVIALRGVLAYAKPGWGIDDVTDEPLREAWPILRKEGLIGSSRRRTKVPTDAQTAAIADYFRAGSIRTDVPMADIVLFQHDSTRRISETTRLLWADLDEKTKTILVRDMKHPRHKVGNHKRVALPDEAFAIVMRQPRRSSSPEARIFPYLTSRIQRLYHQAVVALGYDDLRLHDSRRGGTTRLLASGRTVQEAMLVTGHDTPLMVLTTYNGLRAEDFHKRTPA